MQSDKGLTPAQENTAPNPQKSSIKRAPKSATKAAPKKAATEKKAVTKTAKKTPTPAVKKTGTKSKKETGKFRIRFEIYYSTQFGQSLLISGTNPVLGGQSADQAPVMTYIDDQKWAIELELDKTSVPDGQLSYNYLVRHEDGALSLSAPYEVKIPATASSVTIRDAWNAPGFIENAYGTDALQAFVYTAPSLKTSPRKKYTHRFIITAPPLEAGKAICIIGADASLGGWDADKAIVLTNHETGRWSVDLSLKLSQADTPYKYGIYDLATGRLEKFEQGENRILATDATGAALLILQNGFIRTN